MAEFRALAFGLAMFLAGPSVAGCSASDPATDLSDVSASLGAVLIGHQSDGPDAGGDSALLVGRLDVLDGCVMVLMDDGTVVIPSFPIGWTELDGSGALSWGGGTAVHVGDDVEIGGGFVPVTEVDLPDGCEADEAFIVTPLAP
jgi:hypothetical protein